MKQQRKLSGKQPTNKSERSFSEISLESTNTMNRNGERIKPHYRDIPLSEMMRYYQPKWLAYVGFIASIMSAFQLPMFGFILS